MPEPPHSHDPTGLTAKDAALLKDIESSIASARTLYAWWKSKEKSGSFADRFELARTFNQPDVGYGFFDSVPMVVGPLRIMGVHQQLHFSWPAPVIHKLHENLREYVLRYFLRSSSYNPPTSYFEQDKLSSVPFLRPFGWCPDNSYAFEGFGYSQLYFERQNGERRRFPASDRYQIVDLRDLGAIYNWVVAKVSILDFSLKVQPLGRQAPRLSFPIQEQTLVVLTPDFVVNVDHPEPGILGEYGLGYALLAEAANSNDLLEYGPGHFSAGFQIIRFQLLEDGTTRVHLVFVVNRPERILNVNFDPVRWGFQLADVMSLGLASRVFWPVRQVLDALPLKIQGFDPLLWFVNAADVLTNGVSRDFCISLESLEKFMLMQHFSQHYSMIVSALLTFGQSRNWSDPESVPDWVIEGAQA
jgi:hypothetical protein